MSDKLQDIVRRVRKHIDAGIPGSWITNADFDARDESHALGLKFGELRILLTALETAQHERADWKSNAQRENAALVQAQQRIAELEGALEDVRRVEAWLRDRTIARFVDADRGQLAACENFVTKAPETRAVADSLAALGRMLKEGK